jgi:VEFS-Box of polycomb protein.
MFLEAKGQELLLKNLYRNFVLHMCNLFDFGLISPVTLYTTIQRLQDMIGDSGAGKEILQSSWQAQRRRWIAGGGSSQSIQPDKPGLGESNRRKSANQSMQVGGSQQHGTTKGQILSMHGQGRKSVQTSNNNMQQHKGQASSSTENSQNKRKSSQASSCQQNMPLSNIQQNSIKGQSNGSNDGTLMQQRRKSASSLVSHGNVGGNDPVMMQQRRRSLGQQNQNQNSSQNHSESLPPLRRKSFHQVTSNSDQTSGKHQVLNSQGLVSSVGSEVSHRRKSTNQNSDFNHLHSNHSSKSNGS